MCEATDADGDDLEYSWSTDGGMINGEGDNVTWIAPDTAGNYAVSVMVTDGKGGEATDSVTITVTAKPNQPPIITSLAAEKDRLRVWNTTTIECIATDPDGDRLRFIWAATGGKVQGTGREVGWTAPGVVGDYKITVKVTDGKGGEAEASLDLNVLCCGN